MKASRQNLMRIGEKRSVSVPICLDALGKTLGVKTWETLSETEMRSSRGKKLLLLLAVISVLLRRRAGRLIDCDR